MNRDEFERAYAERSGVTVEYLHEHGRFGIPCHCGEELCDGWQMLHTNDLNDVDIALMGATVERHLARDQEPPPSKFDFNSYPAASELPEWWNSLSKGDLWAIEVGDVHNLLDLACEEIERLRALPP